ncbi:2'-5' RNA ligase family protein [Arthrobacter sp. H5]|uniref:2'-5' RNA ligase family protein n=1 Tax=Arthrobacter sp. H5 TaxID=1267973 RepID=UPI0004BB1D25|nr:2'-5' RNA ligase family protein [Arthrobacter sp. H5]
MELLLHGSAEELIRAEWRRLAEAGLPSLASHTAASNRPHVTLAAAPAIPGDHDHLLGDVFRRWLDLRFGGHAIFATGHYFVLARLVMASDILLDVHARIHRILEEVPGMARNTIPGFWTPHVTIARRMSAAQVGAGLTLLGTNSFEAGVGGIRRWDSHERTVISLADYCA